MSNIRSYTSVSYNGEAFAITGDVTHNPGFPEIMEGTAYTSGNKPNITTALDLSTAIARTSFNVPNTAEMYEMVERIRRENINGQRGSLTLIASDGTTFTHVNAFIKNQTELNFSPDGSIAIEICSESLN